MEKYQFTLNDQLAFAKLSGDYNPIHVDPISARRNLFGRPVVHGVHSVLWVINQWLKSHQDRISLTSLKATFSKPVFLDENVSYIEKAFEQNHVVLELSCLGVMATRIEMDWQPFVCEENILVEDCFPKKQEPNALSRSSLVNHEGKINLCLHRQLMNERFPNLIRCLPSSQISILLGSTYIVGMQCPGLNSLYSELSLNVNQENLGPKMIYRVSKFDERFNLINISVSASSLTGTIKAFVRPTPQAQPEYAQIKSYVTQGEFKEQHALVLGGSRGLGEVVSKILAAGGAKVLITYAQGEKDAQKVVNEITDGGQYADFLQLNVLDPGVDLAHRLAEHQPITHLYYFATPHIGSAVKGSFSPELFDKLCAYYVRGFVEVVNLFKPLGLQRVFYPSTVYIDELPPNMGEYVASKLAAESVCEFLNKTQMGMKVWAPRLPRMSTDQTISLVPIKNQDPLIVMLHSLRSFRNLPISLD